MAPARILIVDHQAIVAKDLEDDLKGLGYTPLGTALSGQQAIQQATEMSPDLVLMDIRLQGEIDGVQAAAEIRQHLDIPVIYLTAHSDEETLQRAKITEPFGYILKPYQVKELHSTIEMALHKHQMGTKLRVSEARCRAFSELTSDLAYSLRVEQNGALFREWATEAFGYITGYSPKEAGADDGWVQLIHPDDVFMAQQHLEALLSGHADTCEFRAITKSGDVRWLRDYARPVWDDAQGHLVRVIGAMQDITEQVMLEQALRQRNQELAILNQLGRELSATLNLQQVVERLLPTITKTINAEGASVWLWEEGQEDGLVCRAIARGQDLSLVNLRLRPEQGIAGWVVQNGKSVVVPYARDDPRFSPGIDDMLGFFTTSLVAVPLEARGKVIGVLEVVNKLDGVFDADDLAIVDMLAASVGIAIDNARLFETLQQRNRELTVLNQAGQALNSILDLDRMLESVLEEMCRLLGVTASSLWLSDPTTNELVCRYSTGPLGEMVCGWRLAPGQGIAGWVAQNAESLVIADTRKDARHFKGVDAKTGVEMRSILSVPLRFKDGGTGALQMLHSAANRFKPMDLVLVESMASTATIAIENARLYKQAQQNANTQAMLLHEINHRVKNNLSAIIGVLYAERQHAEIEDQTLYQSVMQDLISRVQGLATVHKLLSSSDWAPLRLSTLASRIIQSSLQAVPRDKQVAVSVAASPIRVTPDQAHHLALVINELTTNTAKHALRNRDRAEISVCMHLDEGTIHCEYRDDGPGYPEDVLRLERCNVGFDIIQNIVRDGLRGELVLRNDQGAANVIRFSAQVLPDDKG